MPDRDDAVALFWHSYSHHESDLVAPDLDLNELLRESRPHILFSRRRAGLCHYGEEEFLGIVG